MVTTNYHRYLSRECHDRFGPPKFGPPGPDFFLKSGPPGTNFTEIHGHPKHIWTPQGVHILLKPLFPSNTLTSES